MMIEALCGLDLREYRRKGFLVHWVDPKALLRFLLHCHLLQLLPERDVTIQVQADLVLKVLLQYSEEQWECALCSTQEGDVWCLWALISDQALGALELILEVRGSLCSVLVSAGMATKLGRGGTASGLMAVHLLPGVGCSGATPTHLWLCGSAWRLYQLLTISLVTI